MIMSDEMKLLRAFIEASGYEIKEDVKIKTHEISYMQLHGMTQEEKNKWTSGSAGGMVSRKVRTTDYKVTKKEDVKYTVDNSPGLLGSRLSESPPPASFGKQGE
jgi:hypothetical protein